MADDDRKSRLVALDAKREKIMAKSGPLRAELDELVKMQGKEQKIRERIKDAEKELYDIDMERAKLQRGG